MAPWRDFCHMEEALRRYDITMAFAAHTDTRRFN